MDTYQAVYDATFATIVNDTTSQSADELAAKVGQAVHAACGVDTRVAACAAFTHIVGDVVGPETVASRVANTLS